MFAIYVQHRIFVYSGKGVRSSSFNTIILWPNHLPAIAETVYRESAEGGLTGKSFEAVEHLEVHGSRTVEVWLGEF